MLNNPRHGVATMSDGCPIAWQMDGNPVQPALVLSNSLGTNMDMWLRQVPELSTGHCLVRYDSRGHGRSGAPQGDYTLQRLGEDVLELLDQLAITRAHFCGLSLGGMVGQWLAVHAPHRLDRLVIANSSPYMGPPSAWRDRIALVRKAGVAAIADAVIERWFTSAFRVESHLQVAEMKRMLLATSIEGYCGSCAAIASMDMRPSLPRINVPVLVIGGELDPATPPDHARALAGGITASRLVTLHAAHLSNVEQPEQFNEAVALFLSARPHGWHMH